MILSGELCPDGDLDKVTSKEAYGKWLKHYNYPPAPAQVRRPFRCIPQSPKCYSMDDFVPAVVQELCGVREDVCGVREAG